MKRVYLDYAATTPTDPRVVEVMKPYFSEVFGNASSIHTEGQEARSVIEESRKKVAKLINADDTEIIFTSSGSEANNLALKGVAFANKDKGKHIVISAIEHHAVDETVKWLKSTGYEVTIVPVDKHGLIDLDVLEKSIRDDTIIVSTIFASNEIGTIEPVKEIGEICKRRGVYFHTDAVQAFGKIPIDVKEMNVDMLSASSHKIYGPKGVGMLFVKKGTKVTPLIHGGGHEFGLRSSTENVAGIVGFAEAVELRMDEMNEEVKRLTGLRDYLIENVLKIKDSRLNGHPTKRLPNNANFSFSFIEGEGLVTDLDFNGIATSTGSACSTKSLEPSHVLLAIGLKHEEAHGSLRVTLGKDTTKEDLDHILEVLPKSVEKLRKISPFKGDWK